MSANQARGISRRSESHRVFSSNLTQLRSNSWDFQHLSSDYCHVLSRSQNSPIYLTRCVFIYCHHTGVWEYWSLFNDSWQPAADSILTRVVNKTLVQLLLQNHQRLQVTNCLITRGIIFCQLCPQIRISPPVSSRRQRQARRGSSLLAQVSVDFRSPSPRQHNLAIKVSMKIW